MSPQAGMQQLSNARFLSCLLHCEFMNLCAATCNHHSTSHGLIRPSDTMSRCWEVFVCLIPSDRLKSITRPLEVQMIQSGALRSLHPELGRLREWGTSGGIVEKKHHVWKAQSDSVIGSDNELFICSCYIVSFVFKELLLSEVTSLTHTHQEHGCCLTHHFIQLQRSSLRVKWSILWRWWVGVFISDY